MRYAPAAWGPTDKVTCRQSSESWLDQLGLGQYAAMFVAHAIDIDVVTDLTDADLVDLGVAPLGHRKRLLNAIAGVRQSRADTFVVDLRRRHRGPHNVPRRSAVR